MAMFIIKFGEVFVNIETLDHILAECVYFDMKADYIQ